MDKKFVGEGLSIRMGIDYGMTALILIFLNIWLFVLQPEQFFHMWENSEKPFEGSFHRYFGVSFETQMSAVFVGKLLRIGGCTARWEIR